MPEYMIVLHDNPADFQDLSPDEIQRIIQKYIAWGQTLRDSGIHVHSRKLREEGGRVLRRREGGVRVTDGPYSETKEVLGGYFLITAASYDEAVAICRDCPHLEFGGTIELREVDPV